MTNKEKEAIEFLKFSLLDYEELDIGVLEYIDEKRKTLLNYIDKQEKIIDSLAQWVSNLSPMVDKQAVRDIIYKENKNE